MAGLGADWAGGAAAEGGEGSFCPGGPAIKMKIAMAARLAAMIAKTLVWKKAGILIRSRRMIREGRMYWRFARMMEVANEGSGRKTFLWYL
jgi:hypothetical protein